MTWHKLYVGFVSFEKCELCSRKFGEDPYIYRTYYTNAAGHNDYTKACMHCIESSDVYEVEEEENDN